jgi:hypothetical protein
MMSAMSHQPASIDFDQAMSHLGVVELPAALGAQLDRDGYIILPNVIDADWLEKLRKQVDYHSAREGAGGNHECHAPEPGAARLADLVNKGEVFDRVWTHPLVLAAIRHVLGPFKLSSLNYREALKGSGHQEFHSDWGPRVPSEPFHVVNSLWLLDDFCADNGATRLIPGSHLIAGNPRDHMSDPSAVHPRQIVVNAPAGSVVVFNSHVWHGGTTNTSGARRRGMHAYYTSRAHAQQTDQMEYLRLRTWRRLSLAQRWLLDVPLA